MTFWPEMFLGAIAVATMIMAGIQVGAIVYAGRLARRVEDLTREVEHEIKPLIARLTEVSTDAARAASLAVSQMELVDRLVADLSVRIEQTVGVVQNAIIAPAREGFAVFSALRAAMLAIRELRRRTGSRPGGMENEEALFIG